MTVKKEYLILFVVIVGACLYLYFHQTDRVNYQLPEMSALDKGKIAGIEIEHPQAGSVNLERAGKEWRIQPAGYPAADKTVSDMLEAVSDFDLTALVSESEDYQRYRLAPDQALVVSALSEDGRVLRKFTVGKKAAASQHTFVSLPDDKRVYHAAGHLRKIFDKDVNALRDKTVLAFEKANIRKIEIEQEDTRLTLVKKQDAAPTEGTAKEAAASAAAEKTPSKTWVSAKEGKQADQEAVNSLLASLSAFKCQSFKTDMSQQDLADPAYTVRLEDADTQYTLSLYPDPKEKASDYRGVSSEVSDVFMVSSYKARRVMKSPATLMGEGEKQ